MFATQEQDPGDGQDEQGNGEDIREDQPPGRWVEVQAVEGVEHRSWSHGLVGALPSVAVGKDGTILEVDLDLILRREVVGAISAHDHVKIAESLPHDLVGGIAGSTAEVERDRVMLDHEIRIPIPSMVDRKAGDREEHDRASEEVTQVAVKDPHPVACFLHGLHRGFGDRDRIQDANPTRMEKGFLDNPGFESGIGQDRVR